MVRIEALGLSQQAQRITMDVETIFRIGSCAKAFFAAAACDLGAAKAGAAQRRIAAEMANARIASPLRRSLAAALAQAFAGVRGLSKILL